MPRKLGEKYLNAVSKTRKIKSISIDNWSIVSYVTARVKENGDWGLTLDDLLHHCWPCEEPFG